MTKTTDQILSERKNTHGDYGEMSKATMDLMRVLQASENWPSLPDTVQVMFFNMAQKAARIVTGNPYEPDHYADIAGYATLAMKAVSPPAEAPVDQVTSLSADQIQPGGPLIRSEDPAPEVLQPALVAAGLTAGLSAPSGTATDVTSSVGSVAGATVAADASPNSAAVPSVPDVAATAPTSQEGDAGVVPLAAEEPKQLQVAGGTSPQRRRLL